MTVTIELPWPPRSECSVTGCERPHYGKGFCAAHYDRWHRHGDPLRGGDISWVPQLCSVEGCEKPVAAKGLCNAHYKRHRRHGDACGGLTPQGDPMKFLVGAVLLYEGNDCLAWPFSRDAKGYGKVFHDGRMRGAHRVVCEMVRGPAPTPKHEAAHSCGKGHLGCVNKCHLTWKTAKANHADKLIHGTHSRGSRHRMAKLTDQTVRQIRSLRGKVSGRELARTYGVSPATVCNIHKGETWGWLK